MASEEEIKERVEEAVLMFERRYGEARGETYRDRNRLALEPLVRALVKEEDARRRSDEDFVDACKERDQVASCVENLTSSLSETTAALTAQTRARQEAESLAAQARHDAAAFEQAALQSEKERTHAETLLRAEIQELRRTVHLLRAAHVANLRVYLATVEGQS